MAKKGEAKVELMASTTVPTGTSTSASANVSSRADFYKGEKRFALVIGNLIYPKIIGALKNPVNNATDFAKELQQPNFDVQLLTNATYGQVCTSM